MAIEFPIIIDGIRKRINTSDKIPKEVLNISGLFKKYVDFNFNDFSLGSLTIDTLEKILLYLKLHYI